jgi:FkbM family methyltransferase
MDRLLTYDIVNLGAWEPGETAQFRQLVRPGDTVIDVGANIGWYTLLSASLVGPAGQVIAFEPAPPALVLLRRSIATNRLVNVAIEPRALSDRHGSLTLHLHPWNRGHHSIVEDSDHAGAVEVEALPLDEYLQGRDAEIGLIKIDVEGAEGLVLAGMRETIHKRLPRAMIVEYTPGAIRRTGMDPEEVLRRVLAAGYGVRKLDAQSGELTTVDEPGLHSLTERLEAGQAHADLVFERKSPSDRAGSDALNVTQSKASLVRNGEDVFAPR